MGRRLGERRPLSPATRARVYRMMERSLEARYPGHRFNVVGRDDEQDDTPQTAPDAAVVNEDGSTAA
jgi:hypothetical protein